MVAKGILAFVREQEVAEAWEMAGRLFRGLQHRGSHLQLQQSGEAVLGAVVEHDTPWSIWLGSQLIVVAEARVDNRNELIDQLEAAPSSHDVELIGRARERWGLDWPVHVSGDFAVAVWDARQRELSLVRDVVGT